MYVKLQDGREIRVEFHHQHFTNGKGQPIQVAWQSGEPGAAGCIRLMKAQTICIISETKPTFKRLACATARCSTSDQFVKRVGVLLSLRKATAQLSKELRTEIWKAFMPSKNRAIPPAPAPGTASGQAA